MEVLVEAGDGVLLEVGFGPSVHGVVDTVVQGGSELQRVADRIKSYFVTWAFAVR